MSSIRRKTNNPNAIGTEQKKENQPLPPALINKNHFDNKSHY